MVGDYDLAELVLHQFLQGYIIDSIEFHFILLLLLLLDYIRVKSNSCLICLDSAYRWIGWARALDQSSIVVFISRIRIVTIA